MRPTILITNDDGITSKGIKLLVTVASTFGRVVVVAPNSPQSGMGHAITIGNTLRLDKSDIFGSEIEAYECSGTPADCVKLAKNYVLKDKAPDLVLSGVNHGSNTSISVLYSGTMSAAIEAALEGIQSIGFSYCNYDPSANLDHLEIHVKHFIELALKHNIQRGVALNINFPNTTDIKGIRYSRQAIARWQEIFEERYDPTGRRYFWLGGEFMNDDHSEETDVWAIEHGYISVVPCQYDLTDHSYLKHMRQVWK